MSGLEGGIEDLQHSALFPGPTRDDDEAACDDEKAAGEEAEQVTIWPLKTEQKFSKMNSIYCRSEIRLNKIFY